ncbi:MULTISPECIES: HAD family hydrolase [Terrabacteria group]|uniref:HAD family hydrolase n=1 Tax=Bacillati TaxID=1783272 RepID=UPI00193A4918|nr:MULTISPECIES: HAD hydrolase-like protein [Terrabacteria group]MBW9211950.1 HAD family hydrolase [Trueperella sp. zg.1013]QRG87250.1 HAD hydrolase-like protein [Bulleidia sp. zg-1006]
MKIMIWDFNGTIIDDVQLCIDIENQMAKDWNLQVPYITKELYQENFCFPVIHYYQKMGYDLTKVSYEQITHEFQKRFDEGYQTIDLCLGFQERAKEFQRQGYRQVILSATQQNELDKQVKNLKIDGFFDDVIGIQDHLANSKVQRAMDWMQSQQINPKNCTYLGDTDHDYEVAKAIGVENIYLIAQGHQSFSVLEKTGARVLNSLLEWF